MTRYGALFLAVLLASCGERSAIDIVAKAEESHTAQVSGKVLDRDGQSLAAVRVTASHGGATVESNEEGNFTFSGQGTGTQAYHFHLAGFRDTISDSLNVGFQKQYALGNMALVRRYGVLWGRVVDVSGNSLEEVGVALESGRSSALSGFGGNFRMEGVESGTFRIFASHKDHGFASQLVELSPEDSVIDLVLQLEPSGAEVFGRVVDSDGRKQFRAEVSLGPGSLSVFTDAEGVFRFEELPPETVMQLRVTASSGFGAVVGGLRLSQGKKLDLGDILVLPAGQGSGMTLFASTFHVPVDSTVASLIIHPSVENNDPVDYFLWDFNLDGRTDSTTSTGSLDFVYDGDSTRIQVRVSNTAGNMTPFSPVDLLPSKN